MGVVYRAEQVSLKRVVALKMIRSTLLASEQEVQRFLAEAEAAATLSHPNIVPIYEIGELDGQHYFTMRLIEGTTLGEKVSHFREDSRGAAEVMRTVAEAVHSAHQHGIIHRDLKPTNILVDEESEPHVTDFGLAKQVEADSGLTLSGQIMGSPHYMAPEQARGDSRDTTTAADVYGIGAILYELLTGHPPHVADSMMEILRRVVEEEPATPSSINQSIDRDLETITLKCLEKNPEDRYPSAAGVANDLGRWLERKPIIARPASRTERFFKWVRRRPVHAGLAGLATAFVLTLGIGGPLVAIDEIRLREAADEARALAAERETETLRTLYFSECLLTNITFGERNDYSRLRRTIERWHPENAGRDLRGWEWYYLAGLFPKENNVNSLGHNALSLSLDPRSGDRLISTSGNTLLWAEGEAAPKSIGPGSRTAIWIPGRREAWGIFGASKVISRFHVETGELARISELDGTISAIRPSPDGEFVAVGTNLQTIHIFETSTGNELAREDVGSYAFPDWSADSSRLYTVGIGGKGLIIWHRDTSRFETSRTKRRLGLITALATHPKRPLLVSGTHEGKVFITDLTTEETRELPFDHDSSAIHSLRWSPDGTRLGSLGQDEVIRTWSETSGSLQAEIRHGDDMREFQWITHDRIAVVAEDRYFEMDAVPTDAERSVDLGQRYYSHRNTMSYADSGTLYAANGKDLFAIAPGESTAHPAFSSDRWIRRAKASPDGRLAVISHVNGPMTVIDLEQGGKIRFQTEDFHWIDGLDFSPDGSLLATAHHQPGQIRVWSTEGGALLHSLPFQGERNFTGVSFNHDGSLLACQGAGGAITIVDTETGDVIARNQSIGSGFGVGVHWEPSGDRLMSAGRSGWIAVWDFDGTELHPRVLPDREPGLSSLAWSPDGSRIASISTEGVIRLVDSWTGAISLRFGLGEEDSYDTETVELEWSPDGQEIVYTLKNTGTIGKLLAPGWIPNPDAAPHAGSPVYAPQGAGAW